MHIGLCIDLVLVILMTLLKFFISMRNEIQHTSCQNKFVIFFAFLKTYSRERGGGATRKLKFVQSETG